ncbi:type 1 glutamine amidotransferase [Streptantibioticus silvisoli]|uniref:Type 1 glutamine amidotransferase n=1 Tax=Streptantibioticus silvisoli TaxID=2705255 RepID=A0ABT6VVL5_9ACTN|nr:type 1 glutamine amidotransferase [Streptantibioticus silvisoli]MDI5962510.1 type 1 glutamine amidotransferase [Streptantibioticus silvisoli]
MRRVLVVQNTVAGGPDRLGRWMAADGLVLDVVAAHAGEPLPRRPAHDALVVLGGGFLPDDDVRAPWLPATRQLVRWALDAATPMLGVCLGGQMLARLAGGEVRGAHGRPECGSTELTLRPEAAGDPLLHGLPARVTAVEHHVDQVTVLPPGATWLASSERCPHQAFRVGDRAWGVQFHPEVPAGRIRGWDADRLTAQGFDREELYAAALRDEPASEPVWREVSRRFAAVVNG